VGRILRKAGTICLIEETESHIVIRLLLGLLLLLLLLLHSSGGTGSGGGSGSGTTGRNGSELGGTLSNELNEFITKSSNRVRIFSEIKSK